MRFIFLSVWYPELPSNNVATKLQLKIVKKKKIHFFCAEKIYFIRRLRNQIHGQHFRDSTGHLDWFSHIIFPIDIFMEFLIRQSPRDS